MKDYKLARNTSALLSVAPSQVPPEAVVSKNYVDIEFDDGTVLRYRKHANGRGLVAHGAKVHADAFVAPNAYIEPGAQVGAGACVGTGAWIESGAIVATGVHIEPGAHIGRNAHVGEDVRVGVRVHLGTAAIVLPGTQLPADVTIAPGSKVVPTERGYAVAA